MKVRSGRRSASALATVALVAVSLGGLAACGSDDDSSGSPSTTESPEAIIAPDSQVTAGLASLRATFQAAHDAIAAKSATASSFPDKLEDQWFAIEGTIKQNDPASYLAFEDALARVDNAVENGDSSESQKAVAAFNATADAYLAKHP